MLNPWVLLGLLGAFVLTNGYTWLKTSNYYVSLCDSAKLESQVKALQSQLAVQKVAADSAAAEREKLQMRETELESVVADYEKQLEEKNEQPGQEPGTVTACVDPRAARALRAIK